MWTTPDGDRTLDGHEAELIRETVAVMIDELELLADQTSFPPLEFGIPVWDSLTWQQKLATLDQVVQYLLRPTPTTLPLTAVYTSAVGAIYEKIKSCIEVELDITEMEAESEFHPDHSWRDLVLMALEETSQDEEVFLDYDQDEEQAEIDVDDSFRPLSPVDECHERWFNAVESLADRVLLDRDYEMEAVLADVEPTQAAVLKGIMGVSSGYFQQPAPDLRDDQVATVLQRVKAITHRRPDRDWNLKSDCGF